MDKDTEVLYKIIGARVSQDTFNALELLAEKYNRSKSTFIRRLIVEKAREDGFEITKTMEQESW